MNSKRRRSFSFLLRRFFKTEDINEVPATNIIIPKRPVSILELSLLAGVNKQTVYRWEKQGIVMDGKVIRLKTYRIGGAKRIEPRELQNFYDALNPQLPERKLTKRKEIKHVQDSAEQARAWLNQ
jgi:hypothetical protein